VISVTTAAGGPSRQRSIIARTASSGPQDRLDRSVPPIAHPAVQAQAKRLIDGPTAIPHALHPPRDPDPDGRFAHGPPIAPSRRADRYSACGATTGGGREQADSLCPRSDLSSTVRLGGRGSRVRIIEVLGMRDLSLSTPLSLT
jgi:hypothetical protein